MPAHLIFGGLFTFLGTSAFAFLSRNLIYACRSQKWPCVSGRLLKTGTRRITVRTGTPVQSTSATVVDFAYAYEVDGRPFESGRVTFSDNIIKTGGSLGRLQEEFRKGETVLVYYDPANPSFSVLKPGPTVYNFTPFITALLFLAVGIIALFFHEQALEIIT